MIHPKPHQEIPPFPSDTSRAGHWKSDEFIGNDFGNKMETSGNELAFLETNWKRRFYPAETKIANLGRISAHRFPQHRGAWS
jgi:hypothetical protein